MRLTLSDLRFVDGFVGPLLQKAKLPVTFVKVSINDTEIKGYDFTWKIRRSTDPTETNFCDLVIHHVPTDDQILGDTIFSRSQSREQFENSLLSIRMGFGDQRDIENVSEFTVFTGYMSRKSFEGNDLHVFAVEGKGFQKVRIKKTYPIEMPVRAILQEMASVLKANVQGNIAIVNDFDFGESKIRSGVVRHIDGFVWEEMRRICEEYFHSIYIDSSGIYIEPAFPQETLAFLAAKQERVEDRLFKDVLEDPQFRKLANIKTQKRYFSSVIPSSFLWTSPTIEEKEVKLSPKSKKIKKIGILTLSCPPAPWSLNSIYSAQAVAFGRNSALEGQEFGTAKQKAFLCQEIEYEGSNWDRKSQSILKGVVL
jgi:hypothetical protein